jgi:hypothetical protein
VCRIGTAVAIAQEAAGIELVFVRACLPFDRWDRRDTQRDVENGGFEDALRPEERYTRTVEHKSLGEYVTGERVAMQLYLLFQEGERGYANALIEVRHR